MVGRMSDPRLEGLEQRALRPESRVALVTGGSRGLGRAIAIRLAEDGFRVVVAARTMQDAHTVVADIAAVGRTAMAVACDVRDRRSVEEAVAQAAAEYGRLDVLVSNAGINRDNLVHKMTDEEWHDVIETTLTGAFIAAQCAQRHMVEQGYGRLILIGSTASAGNRGQINYATAKAGLHGMAKTLAMELGRFGITANVVEPGHVDSPMTRELARRLEVDYEEIRAARVAVNFVKRVGVPEDVAAAVSFLAGEGAGYVTGQVLTVAGRSIS
jgi:3-oxoacyl-[acyl-carrier protein] reductase